MPSAGQDLHFDQKAPAFAKDAGWDVPSTICIRPRKRGERLGEWRRDAPAALPSSRRSLITATPIIVQVHVEHRLVRRLLSRFLSQGSSRPVACQRHQDPARSLASW
jgi:hypothetical protein